MTSTGEKITAETEPALGSDALAYAYGTPLYHGVLRQRPEDFHVEEILGFEPEGSGEHVFLWIEKIGINTQQVADRLARLAKIPEKQISFSGMKDRHAVTRQWFSVHLPGQSAVDWQQLNSDEVTVLRESRHLRKLRRGAHKANRFVITVQQLRSEQWALASKDLEQRIQLISTQGVPNYFGEQRFGQQGMNLVKARQWLKGEFKPKRYQRGIYLSAARSYLFNQVLAKRVSLQSWCELGQGELLMLDGSHSVFPQDNEPDLALRLQQGDIHLTGPLYGKPGKLLCQSATAALEASCLSIEAELLVALEKQGLSAERRALRYIPKDLQYTLQNDRIQLRFTLPSGSYATSLVRELVHYNLGRPY